MSKQLSLFDPFATSSQPGTECDVFGCKLSALHRFVFGPAPTRHDRHGEFVAEAGKDGLLCLDLCHMHTIVFANLASVTVEAAANRARGQA